MKVQRKEKNVLYHYMKETFFYSIIWKKKLLISLYERNKLFISLYERNKLFISIIVHVLLIIPKHKNITTINSESDWFSLNQFIIVQC